MFIKAIFNDALYKMSFKPCNNNRVFLLGLHSIHYLSAQRGIKGNIWPIFYMSFASPKSKKQLIKTSFLATYLPLKLAQLLRLRSLVIRGQNIAKKVRLCVAHTESFFSRYKKMHLLVEALSRKATTRTQNDNSHNHESKNTREHE